MNEIKHFLLPEQSNELYKKEAFSSIYLTKEVAEKINELVDAYNTLNKGILAKEQEQDGRIAKGVLFMKDNLLNSLHDLFELFKNSGDLSSLITSTMLENDAKMMSTLGTIVNVKNFGAKGDGVSDDTYSIKKAIEYAKELGSTTVYFPKGVYCYTDLGNLAIDGLAIIGEQGYKSTVLKCVNKITHNALTLDAFENSNANTPFCYGVTVRNIHVMGNDKTASAFYIRGCVHSVFANIYAGECTKAVFDIGGVMASAFYNINTMNRDYKEVKTIPLYGCFIDTATRGGESVGASTNNTFVNSYFEDCETGLYIKHGDQNTFTGCAFEYNTKVGVKLEPNARMTLFNGCGIENNPVADYIDNGRLTKMMNSYVQYVATIGGANCTIENCLIDSVLVGGLNNEIKNIRFKYHSYSDDGEAFTDNGIGTIVQNLFNIKTAKNIFPTKKRKAFTVNGSPFDYTNDTNHVVEIFMQTGKLADVQFKREGENWVALSPIVPNKWAVKPNETIRFGFTETPSLSYIETYER